MSFAVIVILFSILSTLIPFSHASQAQLKLKWIDSKIDPDAVCNDGSPVAFHFAPATDPAFKDTYLIYLPGGGQCFDYESCTSRWKDIGSTYMSSKSYASVTKAGGIFDTDSSKSPFWGANKIRLGYCTSDGYMGDIGASEKTWGWHFRGARMVITLVKDLVANYGLSEKSTIIMSGASAGGRGTMTLLDLLVRDYFPKGSRVVGFLDSPYYLDITPYSASFAGFAYQEQSKYSNFNTTAVLYGDCLAAYNQDESNLWKCQFGQYRVPYIRTPYLMVASQFDSYQLSNSMQTNPPYKTQAETDYALSFGSSTKTNVVGLANTVDTTTKRAYLSWACYNHAVSESDGFYSIKTSAGVSQNNALQQYLALDPYITVGETGNEAGTTQRASTSSNLLWLDDCNGFNCGTHCNARRR